MLSLARSLDIFRPAAAGGAAPASDTELLTELFAALGGGSTSAEVAERLLAETGSLPGALAAGVADLARLGVPQEARRALATLRVAVAATLRRSVEERPCFASTRALVDYLHAAMAYDRIERFRVLFLDNRNRLIGDEVMGAGSVQAAPVYPREVVKRALDLGASALILAHNHTSGDPTPSPDDVQVTRDIVSAARLFDIAVHDHIIIGRQGHVSLGQLGYLD